MASNNEVEREGVSSMAQAAQVESDVVEPIAVVGFEVKFPQDADNAHGFWNLLLNGHSAMTEVPKDRWNVDSFYHPDPGRHDTMHARGGHFMKEDVSLFDAPFFSMTPTEAATMDPQQRSLLECTYHAFENAGIPIETIVGSRTSCYVGSFSREYETILNRDPQLQAKYLAVGVGTAMLANRLSWFYDMRGPSLSLDTACSSSLIALHLAVQSMRNGESDMSVVAGCNLMVNPETNSIPLSNLGFLSRDSICYSFDHRANGYSRGEGTAVMVLKPLKKALHDQDVIRAVIRNTGANQDGRTPGITQPSRDAQAALIRETYLKAGLTFEKTGYFEAHGTGTTVGDTLEAGAIGDVFKDYRTESLIVGAVKSNIGHLEGASGLAGLVKTILILENAIIPGNVWFEKSNSNILPDQLKLKFPTKAMAWPQEGLRRASVNSFGYGGSNAHVIVDDAFNYLQSRQLFGRHRTVSMLPKSPTAYGTETVISPATSERARLFVFSASDEGGIQRLSERYQNHFQGLPEWSDEYLESLAYTLSNRRSHMAWKAFLISKSLPDFQSQLADGLISKPIRSSSSVSQKPAFVFSGQGAQWYAMGRELSIYPVFRNSLLSAQTYLTSLGCDWKVIEELNRPQHLSSVDDPALAQPLCTILQIALAELLAVCDLTPSAVVGHSSGEIAAAYCAGGISKFSAYKIAYFRGILSAKLAKARSIPGSMIMVSLSEDDVQPHLDEVTSQTRDGYLVVGCVNSPKSLTLSGDERCVDLFKSSMDRKGVFAQKLKVPVAYHSSHMQDIVNEYLQAIQDITIRAPVSPDETFPSMISSVTGVPIERDDMSKPGYWVGNMVSQVKFSSALVELCRSLQCEQHEQTEVTPLVLVEIGPRAALRRPIQEILKANGDFDSVSYESALALNVDAVQSTMELVGKLHCRGYKTNIFALNTPNRAESEVQFLVDLPQYPFNHSHGYWLESRISHNFRFRKFPRHELLGVQVPDWNPLEAKWRHIIRVSELPWIKDHKFNGSELYPAAGMLVMAIEAARQMADPNREIKSYSLEDVSFFKALLVNLTLEGVETQFHLRPEQKTHAECNRHSFQLYLLSSEEWIEVCRGIIVTNYKDERINKKEKAVEQPRQAFHGRYVDSTFLYNNLASYGFEFGPTFQSLKDVFYNDEGEAIATVDPSEWRSKVGNSHLLQDHVIHPTVLDAIMHLTAVGDSAGTWNPIRTFVPTRISKLWVSNDLLLHYPGQNLQVKVRTTFRGYRDTEFTAAAYDHRTDDCQIMLDGYQATAITSLAPSNTRENSFAFDLDWKPDVDLLTEDQLRTVCCETTLKDDAPSAATIDDVELLCLFYFKKALEQIEAARWSIDKKHFVKYIEWMKKTVNDYETVNRKPMLDNGNPSLNDNEYFQLLLDRLPQGPEIDLYNDIGKKIPEILNGEIDALDLLFGDENRAQSFYTSAAFKACNEAASTYVDIIAHKNPSVKILEVGAGTGAVSAVIIKKLAMHGNNEKGQVRFSKYTYTDISPAFFQASKDRFNEYWDRIEFKVFDVEKDPVEQGFTANEYDIVVASAVIHATSNISRALRNIHKLLKPNGKLVLVEPSNPAAVRVTLIFGLLPGWWLSEEVYRFWSPLLSDDAWDTQLKATGFKGADVCFQDYNDHRRNLSVITSVATEPGSVETLPIPRTSILVQHLASAEHSLAIALNESLQAQGIEGEVLRYCEDSMTSVKDTFCVCLLETERPFLASINNAQWKQLGVITQSAAGILWVTRGRENDPTLGLTTGLGRSILTESPDLRYIDLALEATCANSQAVKHITNVIKASMNSAFPDQRENEYEEKNGILHINRVVNANWLNDHVDARVSVQRPQQRRLGEHKDEALSLTISNPGVLDSLHFQAYKTDRSDLAADEVEINVKVVGVNFKDWMIVMGHIPANSLGFEFSGEVVRTSSGRFRPGDQVCGLSHNAFTTKLRCRASALVKIPDGLSLTTAACIPMNFAIAYHVLINLANLKRGESVLIHSGAGGVGQAAIQLAAIVGADIYTTVGDDEKKKLLGELYNIPEHRICVGRDVPFVQQIQKEANGVDVVLSSLGWEGLRQSFECTLPFGRVIDISTSDRRNWGDLPATIFASNITYATVDMGQILTESKPLLENLMISVEKLLASSQITAPSPINIFRADQVIDAFHLLQSGKGTGKTVIKLNDDDVVPVVPSSQTTYNFHEDASYIIAGGLGSIGKITTRWMVERGAKNLILLGRSGANGQGSAVFLEEMKAKGVNVWAPACDITDYESLSSVLRACAETMPRIRGCIQSSMVLRDNLLSNMIHEDYVATIQPKVAGSWNLHLLLPESLDFFLLLSSASGIVGTRGQANYASGNTYQDALARYRVARGQKAISLDLGLVLGIGFAAQNNVGVSNLLKLGFRGIVEKEYLAVLDCFCDPGFPMPADPRRAQIVTGLQLPRFLQKDEGSSKEGETAERWISWVQRPLFRNLTAQTGFDALPKPGSTNTVEDQLKTDYQALLAAAGGDSHAAAARVVANALKGKVARMLHIPEEDIDTQKSIHTYGVDSLVAVELRYWLSREIQADLSVFEIMGDFSMWKLSWFIAKKSKLLVGNERRA